MLQDYYDKKVLFLTGCTGFVDKVFLEKTLCCIPNIAQIYLLIRQKNGSNLMERLKRDILDSQCFNRLRNIHGSGFEKFQNQKIYPIEGDMLKDGLGLSLNDKELIVNNVNIIINCAANVDFNAIQINVRGAQRFIALAQKIKNLENFIHISTTYVNSDKKGYIEENIYNPDQENLEQLVTQLLKTPVSILEKNVKDIIGNFPNTYAFTKCIAEKLLVQTRSLNFPLTLIRPSIIGASLKNPFPGWIDNLVASSVIFFFAGSGLIKILNGDKCLIVDQVPVDFVADFILTAGWSILKWIKRSFCLSLLFFSQKSNDMGFWLKKQMLNFGQDFQVLNNYINQIQLSLRMKNYIKLQQKQKIVLLQCTIRLLIIQEIKK